MRVGESHDHTHVQTVVVLNDMGHHSVLYLSRTIHLAFGSIHDTQHSRHHRKRLSKDTLA